MPFCECAQQGHESAGESESLQVDLLQVVFYTLPSWGDVKTGSGIIGMTDVRVSLRASTQFS